MLTPTQIVLFNSEQATSQATQVKKHEHKLNMTDYATITSFMVTIFLLGGFVCHVELAATQGTLTLLYTRLFNIRDLIRHRW